MSLTKIADDILAGGSNRFSTDTLYDYVNALKKICYRGYGRQDESPFFHDGSYWSG
ncbi:MAG: hypothetical protein ACI3Y0_12860 [Prevotella sp.]